MTKIALTILMTGFVGALCLNAADPAPGGAPQRTRPGAGGNAGGPGFRGGMLDEQQREQLRASREKYQDEANKLDEKMREAQKELTKAILAEKQDEKALREKAEAVAKIQVEQTLLRAKMFAPVVPTLKPEQKEQLLNNPFGMNMMMGGFGGMRRPGGGAPDANR